MELSAPDSYRQADRTARALVTNGCGPQSWKFDLIPDHLIGVDMREVCNIHDWDYAYHEGRTRKQADKRMLRNMRARVIEHGGILTVPRLVMAQLAYWAIRLSFSGRRAWG